MIVDLKLMKILRGINMTKDIIGKNLIVIKNDYSTLEGTSISDYKVIIIKERINSLFFKLYGFKKLSTVFKRLIGFVWFQYYIQSKIESSLYYYDDAQMVDRAYVSFYGNNFTIKIKFLTKYGLSISIKTVTVAHDIQDERSTIINLNQIIKDIKMIGSCTKISTKASENSFINYKKNYINIKQYEK